MTNIANRRAIACVVVASLFIAVPCYAQSEGWSLVSPLNVPRFAHAAVTLPDGRVLITAGLGSGHFEHLSATEIYDPATDTWSNAAPLSVPRQVPSATVLNDARVLVAGGYIRGPDFMGSVTSADADVTEIFDPAINSWTIGPPLLYIGSAQRAVRLLDGRVLAVGGFSYTKQFNPPGGAQGGAQLFDPASAAWAPAGQLAVPRDRHAIALMLDGRVLVAGGTGNPFVPTTVVEAYNPSAGVWSTVSPMPGEATRATAATLTDGRVLVAGSGAAYLYEPWVDVWTTVRTGPSFFDVQPLPDGGALLLSGSQRSVETWRFDAATSALAPADPMPVPVLQTWPSVGVVMQDNAVLVTGGLDANDDRSSAAQRYLVEARDATPPTIISVTASPSRIWPPNKKMVPVSVSVDARDEHSTPVSRLVRITADDGATADDWSITGALIAVLRAKRTGSGSGRTYVLEIETADASGNVVTSAVSVYVPHDQRKR
jgi:hypothetical protein